MRNIESDPVDRRPRKKRITLIRKRPSYGTIGSQPAQGKTSLMAAKVVEDNLNPERQEANNDVIKDIVTMKAEMSVVNEKRS